MRDIRERLRTGALNINRGTIGASLRLPSVGLGTSSNGINGGVELLKLLSHPRSQLTEVRRFETLPKLPGINWAEVAPVAATVDETLPPQDEPTEVGDLSSYLELATD